MVAGCERRGIVFAGGTLQRAVAQVQEAAARLRAGEYGSLTGGAVHSFGGEISGGGCQAISVLRLLANSEVVEVVAFERLPNQDPPEMLDGQPMLTPNDNGRNFAGQFRMASGLVMPFHPPTGNPDDLAGVDVWSETTLVRWAWESPQVFERTEHGAFREIEPDYSWPVSTAARKPFGLAGLRFSRRRRCAAEHGRTVQGGWPALHGHIRTLNAGSARGRSGRALRLRLRLAPSVGGGGSCPPVG